MAAAPSTAERELQLLEKVEFRILGVANKEAKLNDLLQVYLPPVILKAGSEHASVRAKVIQMLGPVKTFIQPPE
jgi:proteasome component ECM29